MLKILLTPTSLVFKDLTDELHYILVYDYDLELVAYDEDHKLEGPKDYLFKVLVDLSYNYDIEII